MPYRANYPGSVTEVLNPNKKYKPQALRAVRKLARSKPWQGTAKQRFEKLDQCLYELAAAYGVRKPGLDVREGNTDSFSPAEYLIRLCPNMSVVTLLHEFGHARGFDERQTCEWSINLFRRCFPRSFERCRARGHMLIAPPRNAVASRRSQPRRSPSRHTVQVRAVGPEAIAGERQVRQIEGQQQ